MPVPTARQYSRNMHATKQTTVLAETMTVLLDEERKDLESWTGVPGVVLKSSTVIMEALFGDVVQFILVWCWGCYIVGVVGYAW